MREFFFSDCTFPHQSLFIILKLFAIFIILDNNSHFIPLTYCFPSIIVNSATLLMFIISNYLSKCPKKFRLKARHLTLLPYLIK